MENSKIEWCDHTFNPWIGCAKVSAGCANCYAERLMDTRFGRVQWGVNGTRLRTSADYWRRPHVWNRRAGRAGRRERVFCASLADVFEDRLDLVKPRADLFDLITDTPNLDWLLLTKRPQNAIKKMPAKWRRVWPENVWIGATVEDQAALDERKHLLASIPDVMHFYSIEPMLGPIDLDLHYYPVSWVIVGGETGPGARPMNPDWVRSVRDQCLDTGIPFFFKGWGDWWPHDQGQWLSDAERHIPTDAPMDDYYLIGKKAAGRLLDGSEWSEFPRPRMYAVGV